MQEARGKRQMQEARWTPKAGCELPTRRAQVRRQMIFFSLIVTFVLGAEIISGGTAGQKRTRPEAGTPGGGGGEEEKEEGGRKEARKKSRTFTRGEEKQIHAPRTSLCGVLHVVVPLLPVC